MAHIFRKHTPDSKGIVVLTHKEIEPSRWAHPPSRELPFFESRLTDKYFIGVHHGSQPQYYPNLNKAISFFMASPTQAGFGSHVPFFIPFNSRSFLPSFFKPLTTPKYWDIINVSRNIPLKRLDIFIKSVRQLYDQGNFYKVLLIVPTEERELRGDGDAPDIVKQYESSFSLEEQQHFTLLKLTPEFRGAGLPLRTIAHFYNSSKVFAILSDREGESRVIHEALCCGLPIVCNKELVGGGRDFLNSSNSVQFSNYTTVAPALKEAVERSGSTLTVEVEDVSKFLLAENTLPILKDLFSKLYDHFGEKFDCDAPLLNTDNLPFRLPGHHLEVPWYDAEVYPHGADILSCSQCETLFQELRI